MHELQQADEARYRALVAIIDQVTIDDRPRSSDIYASAAQSLFWPEIVKLRQEQVSEQIRDAIREVVQYNWADERKDYEQMKDELEDLPADEWHIFHRLVTLANFLDGTTYTADDHI
jgi:FMN phosphatase YigB (HAD superfamily)